VLGAFVGELRRSLVWCARRALSLSSVADAQTGSTREHLWDAEPS
jgi:hypothetical protein